MKHKHLLVLLALLFVGAGAMAQQFVEGHIKYEVSQYQYDNVIVYGYERSGFQDKLVIPSQVTHEDQNYNVVSIESGRHAVCNQYLLKWFQCYYDYTGVFEKTNIDTLDFGNGVSEIPSKICFNNNHLKHIYLGNQIVAIYNKAFKNCHNARLDNGLPQSLQEIRYQAFYKLGKYVSDAQPLVIPENVEKIDEEAFYECRFPGLSFAGDKLTSIYDKVFYKAIVAGDINLPDHITRIYRQAFYQCHFRTFTSGEHLSQIDDEAFYGNDNLYLVVLEKHLDSIGKKAFANCTSLCDVTCLCGNPPALGANAFQNIYSNATLTVPAGSFNAYYNSDWHNYFPNIVEQGTGSVNFIDGNFRYRVNDDNVSVTLVGPADGVTISGTQVFGNTVSYNGHTYNVTKIGNYAFNQCSGITAVSIQSPIMEIGDCAFSWCTQLNSVALPNTLKSIGYGAFGICPNLHLSTSGFPNSLEEIGDFAFWGCSLNNVNFGSGLKYIGMGAFVGGGISGQLNLPNSLEYIGDGAFENCPGLTGNLIIPNNVWYIGDYAFWQCPNLTGTLNIPSNVRYLGIGAFKQCTGFTGQLHTPTSMHKIPAYAFYGCTGITGWTCHDDVYLIDKWAFAYSGLQTLQLGAEVDSISVGSFRGCSNLSVVDARNVYATPNIAGDSFDGVPCVTLKVSCGSETYYTNSNWSAHFTTIESDCHDGYSFDDNTFEGWTTIDADDDGHDWFVKEQYEFHPAHTGNYYVASESYSNSAGTWLYPDNYLVSPGKSHYDQIRFYARAEEYSHPAEHFGVAISTGSNTNPDDFTTIQEWTMTAKDAGSWHEYTVDLSSYDVIWVAIRHFNCTDQSSLCVDDIALGHTPVVNSVQIDEFIEPVFGEHPNFNIDVPVSAPYTISSVVWYEDDFPMTESGVFQENSVYYMRVKLLPVEGYSLSEAAIAYFSGDCSIHDEQYNVLYNSGELALFTIDFYVHENDGVAENSSINLAVYPNPTRGTVNIAAESLRSIEIFNIMGQKVFETEASGDTYEYNFNGATGLFLIRVETSQGVETKRIVVK